MKFVTFLLRHIQMIFINWIMNTTMILNPKIQNGYFIHYG